MTVETTNSTISYTGNNSVATFAYNFLTYSEDHLFIYLDDVEQTSGFSITGIGDDSGGSVIFDVAPFSGVEVRIDRTVPETQLIEYQEYGPFKAKTNERGLDLGVMIGQQNARDTGRNSSKKMDKRTAAPENNVVIFDDEGNSKDSGATIDGINVTATDRVIPFDTLDEAVNETNPLKIFNGAALNLAGRNTKNDGGGAMWDVVDLSSVTPNTFDIVQCVGIPTLALVLREGGSIFARQVGVVGDGATDDTNALSAALKYRNVVGGEGLKIRTTASIIIENELDFNLAGAEILGETFLDAEPWFYFRHDNINMYGGTFGDGTVGGKPIVIGDYADPEVFYRGFNVHDNLFNIGDITINKGFISGVGRVFELNVYRNRFQSGALLTGNISAVLMQNAGATIDNNTQLSWKIENNISVGIPYLFNNFSSGFAAGVTITNNTIRDGEEALRTYHLYECIVANNTFVNNSGEMYIWQRTDFTDNVIQGCGDNNNAVKFETPTSTVISGNDIRNSNGNGTLIDGGNADFSFTNNMIFKSSGSGLVINPNSGFGGQNIGTVIKENRITQNFSHGISIVVSSALRSLEVSGNYIAGNGLDNPTPVAAIYFDNSGGNEISRFTSKENTFINNDPSAGVQTANTTVGVYFEGVASYFNNSIICNNVSFVDALVSNDNTSVSSLIHCHTNYVQNLPDPGISSVYWSNNYNNTNSQTSHRRNNGTPVGVLTPLWLGEEVFDTGGQDWYKSVGASLGPWTSADWKPIT